MTTGNCNGGVNENENGKLGSGNSSSEIVGGSVEVIVGDSGDKGFQNGGRFVEYSGLGTDGIVLGSANLMDFHVKDVKEQLNIKSGSTVDFHVRVKVNSLSQESVNLHLGVSGGKIEKVFMKTYDSLESTRNLIDEGSRDATKQTEFMQVSVDGFSNPVDNQGCEKAEYAESLCELEECIESLIPISKVTDHAAGIIKLENNGLVSRDSCPNPRENQKVEGTVIGLGSGPQDGAHVAADDDKKLDLVETQVFKVENTESVEVDVKLENLKNENAEPEIIDDNKESDNVEIASSPDDDAAQSDIVFSHCSPDDSTVLGEQIEHVVSQGPGVYSAEGTVYRTEIDVPDDEHTEVDVNESPVTSHPTLIFPGKYASPEIKIEFELYGHQEKAPAMHPPGDVISEIEDGEPRLHDLGDEKAKSEEQANIENTESVEVDVKLENLNKNAEPEIMDDNKEPGNVEIVSSPDDDAAQSDVVASHCSSHDSILVGEQIEDEVSQVPEECSVEGTVYRTEIKFPDTEVEVKESPVVSQYPTLIFSDKYVSHGIKIEFGTYGRQKKADMVSKLEDNEPQLPYIFGENVKSDKYVSHEIKIEFGTYGRQEKADLVSKLEDDKPQLPDIVGEKVKSEEQAQMENIESLEDLKNENAEIIKEPDNVEILSSPDDDAAQTDVVVSPCSPDDLILVVGEQVEHGASEVPDDCSAKGMVYRTEIEVPAEFEVKESCLTGHPTLTFPDTSVSPGIKTEFCSFCGQEKAPATLDVSNVETEPTCGDSSNNPEIIFDDLQGARSDDKVTCQAEAVGDSDDVQRAELAEVPPYNFLIRVPRFEDESLEEQIKYAQLQLDEKTRFRDAIRPEIQAQRAMLKDHNDAFNTENLEMIASSWLLKSKQQEIDSVQSVINRIKNIITVEDINSWTLKKELNSLKDKVSKAEASALSTWKIYEEENENGKDLHARFKAADEVRQQAYAHLNGLKKRLHERTSFSVSTFARNFASCGDKAGLHRLCGNQVERFLEEWNTNDEFRKDDARRCNKSASRRPNVDEPLNVGPNDTSEKFARTSVPSPCKMVSLSLVEATRSDKQIMEKVARKNKMPKTKELAKPTAARRKEIVNNEEKEKTAPTKEELEFARKAEELRKEETASKLKEQRRLEEKAKAAEAMERKKRNAEKAQIRAELRAQKEAEQKEKAREKRLRRKERKRAGGEASNIGIMSQDVALPNEAKEIDKLNKKPQQRRQPPPHSFAKHLKPKNIPPPPALSLAIRNKKPRHQWWKMEIAVVFIVVLIFCITGFFTLLAIDGNRTLENHQVQ